jgi:hypothetical protein
VGKVAPVLDRKTARVRRGWTLASLLAALVLCLVGLALPACAAAATYAVNSIGDQEDETVGVEGCKTSFGNCTLRAAIQESNASTTVDDTIVFSPLFNGESLGSITLTAALPTVTDPVTIDGGQCQTDAGVEGPCVAVNGGTGLTISAADVLVEHLAIVGANKAIFATSGSSGAEAKDNWLGRTLAGASDGVEYGFYATGPEAKVVGNVIANPYIGVVTQGAGNGTLIEGNTIEASRDAALSLDSNSNKVLGNELKGAAFSLLFINNSASGNEIGADTPASENVFENSTYYPIYVNSPGSNEIARNRGTGNGGPFIGRVSGSANGGIGKPTISGAIQSSVSGTATPGAKVRVFVGNEFLTDINSFIGEAVADGGGNWKVASVTIPVGTLLTATQTVSGGTSELSAIVTSGVDPPPLPATGGGSSSGGGGETPKPDTTKPKVTIKKGPKAKSASTTAKFKFVSDETGSSFQCKFDKQAFAKCKSPKTYQSLRPGKHVFKVRATDAAGNVSSVLTRKFTVLA